MKKLKKLKLHQIQKIDHKQMHSIIGGYDHGGPVLYKAYALNSSGSTMHYFADTSEALVVAWAAAWQAAGWYVRIEVIYRGQDPDPYVPYYFA